MVKDQYNLDFLKRELGEMGYDFCYFQKTDSTMQAIEKSALQGNCKFMIVLADHQTGGMGRNGRTWLDTPDNSLMFSVLFQIKEASIAVFADMVALTICQTLRRITGNTSIKIKYPNDITVNNKKIAGILVKNIYDENLRYLGTNLGVGLNIHYTSDMLEKFSTDYGATSLDICTSSFNNRQDLLIQMLRDLKYLSTEIEVVVSNSKAAEAFDKKWIEMSGMIGKKIAIIKNGRIIKEGVVTNAGIGKGIELQTLKEQKWFSLFDTDMKARILN